VGKVIRISHSSPTSPTIIFVHRLQFLGFKLIIVVNRDLLMSGTSCRLAPIMVVACCERTNSRDYPRTTWGSLSSVRSLPRSGIPPSSHSRPYWCSDILHMTEPLSTA